MKETKNDACVCNMHAGLLPYMTIERRQPLPRRPRKASCHYVQVQIK